jgi:Uma2 family endonuclease
MVEAVGVEPLSVLSNQQLIDSVSRVKSTFRLSRRALAQISTKQAALDRQVVDLLEFQYRHYTLGSTDPYKLPPWPPHHNPRRVSHTTYESEQEHIDGVIRERNVEGNDHSFSTALIAGCTGYPSEQAKLVVLTAQRLQVSPTRTRVPDVVIFSTGNLLGPPLLVVEIVHPHDAYTDTIERVDAYHGRGVGIVWLIDPVGRSGCYCLAGGVWTFAAMLEVPQAPSSW